MVSGVSVSPLEPIPLIDIAVDGRRSLKMEGWHLKIGENQKEERREPKSHNENRRKAGKGIHLEVCNGYLNNVAVNTKTLPQGPLRT
jgi:hypothetical protein